MDYPKPNNMPPLISPAANHSPMVLPQSHMPDNMAHVASNVLPNVAPNVAPNVPPVVSPAVYRPWGYDAGLILVLFILLVIISRHFCGVAGKKC